MLFAPQDLVDALHDVLYQALRSEQMQVNRVMGWATLRAPSEKEKSESAGVRPIADS